ncbi:permease-like cell division protein FtsX [Patescibacteria group bacterium]|nr:permease-like cell division protein FtsX [Patescibacteria group bacterium]MCL5091427.1 permease-like cell division protein FtsX [Patescibacteria group bacterium]
MKSILTSIRRTPYQSTAAFLVLFLNLFLTISIVFSLSFLYGLLGYVETRPQVTVYFQTQVSPTDIGKIRDDLINSQKTISVKYISQEDAFKTYQQLNKDNPLLLEMVSANIFPASLEINAKKPEFLPEIAAFLKKQPGIDEVVFQKTIIDRLLTLTGVIKKSALAMCLLLIITTVFILLTITHFKIALRREEIELWRLLGASGNYIKMPFIKEGLFFGFTAATTAFLVFLAILLYLNPFISSYLRGSGNLVISISSYQLAVWPLNGAFLAAIYGLTGTFGMLLSVIATVIASQKYIK